MTSQEPAQTTTMTSMMAPKPTSEHDRRKCRTRTKLRPVTAGDVDLQVIDLEDDVTNVREKENADPRRPPSRQSLSGERKSPSRASRPGSSRYVARPPSRGSVIGKKKVRFEGKI